MTKLLESQMIWCLTSPALLNTSNHPNAAQSFESIEPSNLTIDSKTMLNWLANQTRHSRLGITFEQCFEAYLRHSRLQVWPYSKRYQNVHNRIQIQSADNRKTLGELDFICKEVNTNTWCHIETAVKFYLGAGEDLNSMHSWIGPNKKDRLDLKYKSLFNKQLNRIKAQETIQKLNELDIKPESHWQTRFWVKGMLFRPWKSSITRLPFEINPNCLMGFWVIQSQLPALRQSLQPNQWTILERNHWIVDDDSARSLSDSHYGNDKKEFERLLDDIAAVIESIKKPVQIMLHFEDKTGRRYLRYFITPDDWPDSIRPSFTQ